MQGPSADTGISFELHRKNGMNPKPAGAIRPFAIEYAKEFFAFRGRFVLLISFQCVIEGKASEEIRLGQPIQTSKGVPSGAPFFCSTD